MYAAHFLLENFINKYLTNPNHQHASTAFLEYLQQPVWITFTQYNYT